MTLPDPGKWSSLSYSADPPVSDYSTQGLIVRNSVTASDDSVKAVQKEAVYLSLLAAQLWSNNVTNMFTDTVGWYKNYIYVLGQIGWTVQNITFEQQQGDVSGFYVHIVLDEIMRAIATGQEVDAFTSMMLSLNASDSDAYKLFSTNALDSAKTNAVFTASTITRDDDGNVRMALSCSYFEAYRPVPNIFWSKYTNVDIDMHTSSSRFTLMYELFPVATLREKLKDYLATDVDVISLTV